MSDDDIKEAYNARRVVLQRQAQAQAHKKQVPKIKSASAEAENEDKFDLPDWIPKVSENKIPKVMSANVYSNSYPVPDISHSVTMCASRERRTAEELTEFLTMFEGIH